MNRSGFPIPPALRRVALLLLAACAASPSVVAQYWGERVLEKSFEQSDLFFVPSYLNPYGLGAFKNSTAGFVKDPLLDVSVNPALLQLDSSRSLCLYTDFRSARTITDNYPWVYPMMAGVRSSSLFAPYPRIFRNSRRELEPVFSGGLIGKPLPEFFPGLTAGLTYQLILQDDRYYSIPQDIYRSSAGYDFNGTRVAAAESIPIVDVSGGTDQIHHVGHALSGLARAPVTADIALAARVSRVTFDRDGSYRSSNLWNGYASEGSYWANGEGRTQRYEHWDAGGGIEYTGGGGLHFGLMGGYLWGDVDQELSSHDSSYWSSGGSASFYNRSGNQSHRWYHDGATWYAGGDLTAALGPAASLRLFYQYRTTDLDLTLGSSIIDTSYSIHHWNYNSTEETSTSRSALFDRRAGGGTSRISANRLSGAARVALSDRLNLTIGLQVGWQDTETRTQEEVNASNLYEYTSTNNSYSSSYARADAKTLYWTFTVHRSEFQIPIFLTVKASSSVDLLFGLTREMMQWRIDDETLAIFRYRSILENQVIDLDENFGERYREPQELVSDVRTSFLAGITVGTETLRFRALMVPVFRDGYDGQELEQLQWWLSMTLSL